VREQRIVIVGAGIVGLSTAYALLMQGMKQVIVLEQEKVGHQRSTSSGISRLLRFEYGSDRYYSELVGLSLNRWRALERVSKRTLYSRTGLLVLGTERDTFTHPSYRLLRAMGLPTERIAPEQCRQRFPQFSTQHHDLSTYNAEGGILHASTCLHILKERILDLGGTIHEGCRITDIKHDSPRRPIHLHLHYGDQLLADRVVISVGPWIHHLLHDLRLPILLTRQYLLYFANLPLSMFGVGAFPAFIANDLYGFPIHTTGNGASPGWLKAATHTFGSPTDPDEYPLFDEPVISQVARRLRDLLPALAQAKLVHVDACMYDVTPDENFIIDYVPGDARVVFATGLTGHGFKFGPLIGELLASLVCDSPSPVAIERFRLARFAQQQQKVSVA
jgi:monomeric sarcosine oxidase